VTLHRQAALMAVTLSACLTLSACNLGTATDPAATMQAQFTLARRRVDITKPTPVYALSNLSGKLIPTGVASRGTVPRFLGLANTLGLSDGTVLELIDTSPPVFVEQRALQERAGELTVQAGLRSRPFLDCPTLGFGSNGRLVRQGSTTAGAWPVIGGHGAYSLIAQQGHLRVASSSCLAPQPETLVTGVSFRPQRYYAVPHGDPTSANQAVLMGLDIETSHLELIVDWFRPNDQSNATWLTMGKPNRVALLREVLRPIFANLSMLYRQHLPEEKRTGWTKTNLAPTFLADELDAEGMVGNAYIVEVKLDRSQLALTLPELISVVQTLEGLGLGGGGRHLHFSFPRTGITERTVSRYVDYYQFCNEMLSLYYLTVVGPAVAPKRLFRPIDVTELQSMRDWLTDGTVPDRLDEKSFRFLAFRTPNIYGQDRYGFEVRAFAGLHEFQHQQDLAALTVQMLTMPNLEMMNAHGQWFGLETFSPGGVRVDTLGAETATRFDPAVLSFLTTLSATIDPHDELYPPMSTVWSLPLVHWWERSFLAPFQSQLEQARDGYIQEVTRFMEQSGALSHQELAEMVSSSLAGWADDTMLFEHYKVQQTRTP
jgi:hypothetical protein